jgi:3-oxoacyl-[acyl-carrier protein] reductase
VKDGPVALVTGASRGIGRAVALGLAASGFDIAALAWPPADAAAPRSLEQLEGAVAELGRQCLPLRSDIADLEQHPGIIADVAQHFGRLDLLVSNAGIAPALRRDVLDVTPDSFDRVLGVNLRGSFFLAQQAARFMLEHRTGAAGIRQALVFITSVSAERSSVNRAEYCVSKAGLSMAARVLADRLAGEGILVYEVRPGIIRTDMTAPVHEKYDRAIADGLVPERRWGEPEDVARAVVALARGDFGYSTGMIVDVSGGLSIPRL